ncbi:MAG TPA: helix-turn-helix domain-containing protein [Phenylobacterium sp.]|nr:helix-turn-helix domain-containing protein [Phenylobacterium sp.]
MVQNEREEGRRPRGRPRSFDPAEALEKARAVFWNQGYAAASLDELAAATGLNRPSLYAAFGDKRALYLAALEQSRSEGIGALTAALKLPGPLRPLLKVIFDRTVDIYRRGELGQRGCFLVSTAVTQAVDDPDARAALGRYVAEMDALFAARFEADRGALAPGLSPAAAAAMATAAIHTLAIRARTGAGETELRAVGQAAAAAICGG